ncbi:sensor histidine kinase [Timonella sp. A28]|uniref:sensor histidine kinase n=1 Tax=Timonella sp. A28 TaxID=3442640 RepID=UPI003EBC83A5
MSIFERFSLWSEENGQRLDISVAVLSTIIVAPLSAMWGQNELWFFGYDYGGIWSGVFAFFLIGPLALRRTHPVLSVSLVFSTAGLHVLLGAPVIFPADVAVLASLYSVTVYGPRWALRLALFFAFVGAALAGHFEFETQGLGMWPILISIFTLGLLFLTVWAFGLMRRARYESVKALREKNQILEIERDQQAKIGAAAERARIAREMHDIVAHSLSVIIAQADGGRYAAKNNPEFAEKALTTISETGRAALADMRRLLGVLREGETEETEPEALRNPQPAKGDIETLVDSIRSSGIRVSLIKMGTPRQLPPGVGLTLYRICQESLTNILKHAGPDPTVTIVLAWGSTNVTLEIEDDGRGAASTSDGAGMGLLGMRERAALFGGTVKTGPRHGGGFRVELNLPVPAHTSEG